MPRLSIEIVSPERRVFADEVDMVIAPGTEGVLGILPNHAPLLTGLVPGELRLKKGSEEITMAVAGGFLQVNANRVQILADAAEREEEIDEARASEARARAEEALRQAGGDRVQTEAARLALRLSLARLQVARRRRRTLQ